METVNVLKSEGNFPELDCKSFFFFFFFFFFNVYLFAF